MSRAIWPHVCWRECLRTRLDRAGWLEYWKMLTWANILWRSDVLPEGSDMVVTYVLHLGPGAQTGANSGFQVVSVCRHQRR